MPKRKTDSVQPSPSLDDLATAAIDRAIRARKFKPVIDDDKREGFSVDEAAAKFGVCRATLYNEARAGRIRFGKVRGRTIVTPDEINKYAEYISSKK